jgi:beta-phosphoglucomutase-like phosphatase (HAD superfamily)
VIDLDNTLVDTRPRTAAALRTFVREYKGRMSKQQRAKLMRTQPNDVGYDAEETATKLGLNKRQARAFDNVWRREFWTPRNLKHDAAIPKTMELIAKAHAEGKKIYFLTGRRVNFTRATVKQLRRIGVAGFKSERLWLKPHGRQTDRFKLDMLRKLAAKGEKIVFIDDAVPNIRAVQKAGLPVEAVAVDFPVNQRNVAPIALGTAVFDPGL